MNEILKSVSSKITSNVIYFFDEKGEEIAQIDMCDRGLTNIPRMGEMIHFTLKENYTNERSTKNFVVENIEHYINFDLVTRSGYQHIYVHLKEYEEEICQN